MTSLKNECDFLIKLDTDEFIGAYMPEENNISVDPNNIYTTINSIDTSTGLKFKCAYSIHSLTQNITSNTIECTKFRKPYHTNFKTFFNSKTFLECDLGAHDGKVIDPYSSTEYHDTNLAIIHYHFSDYDTYLNNCKKACISHGFLDENDSVEEQIAALQPDKIPTSVHKADFYLRHLINPNHREDYYAEYNDDPNSYTFDRLKLFFEKL
jgi:hypothetical protein